MSALARAVRSSDRAALGALYLVDVTLRARVGQLNAVESTVQEALHERGMVLEEATLKEILAAVSASRLEALSADASGAGIVKRVYGTQGPEGVLQGPLASRLPSGPLEEVAPELVYTGQPTSVMFIGDVLDDIGAARDRFKEAKERVEEIEDLTDAAKDATSNAGDTLKNLKELIDRAVSVFEGDEGTPPGGGRPTQYPDLGQPVPNEWIARSSTQPGYRVAIDQIICHEEESYASNDTIAWGGRTVTVLDNGAVLINIAASKSKKEMNGHQKLTDTLYLAQHPGPPSANMTPTRHTHVLQLDEAYLVSVTPRHSGVPRADYLGSDIALQVLDVDAGEWEEVAKAIAAAISVYRGYNKSNPIPAAQLGDLAAAVGLFLTELLKIADDDDELLTADKIVVVKSDIEGAPELSATTQQTISGVPWVREARHDRLRDVSSVRVGPVLHGVRNDQKQSEPHGHWYLGDDELQAAYGNDPWDGVLNEGGSWWYEVRLRYELTEPQP